MRFFLRKLPLSTLKQNTIFLLTISKISNTMRKIYSTLKSVVAGALVAAMTFAVSCSYDDTAMKNRVDKIETDLATLTERVDALEDELDNQVAGLKELINGKVVVTGVETEGDVTTVTLSDGSSFVIDNSKGGATAGDDYTLGAQEDGGVYYWAVFVNGAFQEYLLVDGNKVPVFAEATESGESCACELQMEVREDGKLYVSIDGGANWVGTELPASQVSGACVFASVEVDGDNVIFTLTDGTTFNVQKAELVEFEAAKSAVYVKVAETVAIPFAINDAVEDINVMNTPLGWKAEVVDTRAVGGMDFALNITGPAKEFMQYADKSGKVAIHFNTAAGACKVMSVDVELATIDLQVDKDGNITIVNTLVDKYDRENWGVTEHIEEFNNYYFAVVGIEEYEACEGDLESVYNSNWGEFNIPAAASYIQNFFTNVGENGYDGAIYQDGVNEKWTVSFTVEEVIDYLDWYNQMVYEGNSFMVCVIPTDVKNAGALLWDEMVAVPFKQLALSIVEIEDARAFDNAYFNVTLRGGVAYHLYPMSMKDVTDYVEVHEYYPSMEDLFWDYLNSYLQYPNWYSFGFEITEDVVEENISLSDLLAYTYEHYSFETKPATDYVMALFVWEDGKTEYTKDDLKFFYFSTAELTAAESALEYSWDYNEDHGLYTVAVDLTVAENVSALYTRWYDYQYDESDLVEDLINNGYGRDAADLEANQYTVYVGTSVSDPGTTKYLGALMIDAEGNYTVVQIPVTSNELTINETYTPTIESVTFDDQGAHITVGGLEGAEVKAYKYYIISTTGSSYYQKTEEQLYDVAYSNDWLYQSSEVNPILATRTADYTYSFAAGATYKVAVGVEFADGTYSNTVYGEYVNDVLPTALTSVVASWVESDPNWCYLTLTAETGDVITTSAGNGGVNYLNEGTWDYQNYYSSGFALGNTYMNNTTWVSSISMEVAYTEAGEYSLKLVTSHGVFAYEGAIEGLVVPGFEEPALSAITFTSAEVLEQDFMGWNDFLLKVSAENGDYMVLNLCNMCVDGVLTQGNFTIGGDWQVGAIFGDGYSYAVIGGEKYQLYGGTMTIAEVDGQYSFTFTEMWVMYGGEFVSFDGSFLGTVAGLEGEQEPGEQPGEDPETPAVLEIVSASATHSASNFIGGTGYDVTFIGVNGEEIIYRVQTKDHTYLREGDWSGDLSWSVEGYIDAATWTGVGFPWPYSLKVAVVNDAYDITIKCNDYYDNNKAYEAHFAGQIEGFTLPVEEEDPAAGIEFVIPGEGGSYDYDYKYTRLVDGLDENNSLRVSQDNGWIWDIKFNTGLAEIVAGDYKATNSSFSSADALEVDTYNGGFQNAAYNYIYPDEFKLVTTFNVQKEGDVYCITMIGSGGYGSEGKSYRCVYIGKIE